MAIPNHRANHDGSHHVLSSARRLLLVPRVAWLSLRTPKNLQVGWDRYWSSVRATGVGGDVLWDSADLDELSSYLPILTRHFDPILPLVDIGCGNGSFSRRLIRHFPSVLGVDLSPDAVQLASKESAGEPGLTFRALDVTVPGALDAVGEELGPVNVFVRGVFHILSPAARIELAANLLPLVGSRGKVFLSETNFRGTSLGYLESLGASGRFIPEPLERAIRDLPRPGHFGAPERELTFSSTSWTVAEDGPTVIETIPLRGPSEPEHIPGYFAVMAPRNSRSLG
jgi:SAM-dependent methyltransferase